MKFQHSDIELGSIFEVRSDKLGGLLGYCLILANSGRGLCIGAFFCKSIKLSRLEIDFMNADFILQFSDLDIVSGNWPSARDVFLKSPVKPAKYHFRRSAFSGHHFLEEYDEKVKLIREVRVELSEVGDLPESTLFGSGAVAIRMREICSR